MLDLGSESVNFLLDQGINQMKVIMSYLALPIILPFMFVQECITWIREQTGLDQRSLEGKVVLITGASSGIGEGLAKCFYKAGCRLILASRNKTELERVKNDLVRSKATGRVYVPAILEMDVGELHSIPDKVKSALGIYETIDILINNAGMGYRGTVLNTDIEVDMKIMNVNYFGALALTKAVVKEMIDRKIKGQIVFVSSVQGKAAIANQSAYGASKHAMQAMADSLRAEIADDEIEVTVLSPGYVLTNFSQNAITGSGERYGLLDAGMKTGYSSDVAAEKSFKAIVKRQKDVIIAKFVVKLFIYSRHFASAAYFLFVQRRGRTMNH